MTRGFRILGRSVAAALALLPAYAAFAYMVVPAAWSRHQKKSGSADVPGLTYTAERLPADPLNVAFVGTREDLRDAMRAAGWYEADPITFRSGLRDAASVLFAQPYVSAPMSTHFLADRPQDVAFEQTVGGSPRRRHHVRFWRTGVSGPGEPALWIGAASYDQGIGFSHYTGEVMHHIAPRIDAEREKLFSDLARARRLECVERLAGYRPRGRGVNGGGDAYETDGAMLIGRLKN